MYQKLCLKRNRFATTVMCIAYDSNDAQLPYLIGFHLHIQDCAAINQIKSETGACNLNPAFTKVNS